ncbi:MAG: BF3164 family lipoprotein, partial [Bacteroidota bacterium]
MKLYLNLFFLFFILSCQNSDIKESYKSPNDVLSAFKNKREVVPEVLISDSVNLLKPFMLELYKDYLLVNDKTDGHIYSVYNINDKQFIGRFIKRGRGPDEYLFTYLSFYSQDTIGILDQNKSTISLFYLRSIQDLFKEPSRVLKLNNEKNFYKRFYNLNENLLLSGQFEKNRYIAINKYSGNISTFGEYPDVKSGVDYSNYHLGFIFSQSEDIFVKPDFSYFASLVPGALNIYKLNS